jgi:hypothetical protein
MVETYLNSNLLKSIQQTRTPLNTMFFSVYNVDLLQRAIIQVTFDRHGHAIDRQNVDDLLTIMRSVFVNNASDPNNRICEQVKFMNDRVIKTACNQIDTGLSQFIGYMKDVTKPYVPPPIPENTSIYGKAMPVNTKIGL